MFANLADFGFRRTPLQAFGFYLAYFVLFLALAGLVGALVALAAGDRANVADLATRMGILTAVIACTALSFAIVAKKQLMNHFPSILLALLAGVLGMLGGALLGLLPATYLTTRPQGAALPPSAKRPSA